MITKTPEQLCLLMRKHCTVGGLTDVLSIFEPVKDDVCKIQSKLRVSKFFMSLFVFSFLRWVQLLSVE